MAAETESIFDTDISLDQKLQFLLRPESYPDSTLQVETVETHMSWVFLTDSYAYKLKKPVQYAFLDFSSVEARRWDAEEEIRLNSRLAPHIYLGVVPLTRETAGTLKIGGEGGEAVDWLVKMRRLQTENMLDYAIKRGTVESTDVKRAAVVLAKFYQTALPADMSESAYRERFRKNMAANLRELLDPGYRLPEALVRQTTAAQFEFLQEEAELLNQRVREGKIIEAHGDLRPEHIWLGPEPVVIDCLEFQRDYRILDIADELAFLGMECEHLGAPAVGQIFLQTYSEVTGDIPPDKLLHFYKSYRAALRAKITIWHLNDSEVRNPEKWSRRAMEYLRLAEAHAREL
jgi:aminoglycoside phosphotransferase family enzyme